MCSYEHEHSTSTQDQEFFFIYIFPHNAAITEIHTTSSDANTSMERVQLRVATAGVDCSVDCSCLPRYSLQNKTQSLEAFHTIPCCFQFYGFLESAAGMWSEPQQAFKPLASRRREGGKEVVCRRTKRY